MKTRSQDGSPPTKMTMRHSLARPGTFLRPAVAPVTRSNDPQHAQMQALLAALDTMFHLTVDYSHRNVALCDAINRLNDRVAAGLKLIDPKATFASAEVKKAVTMADDLYQKGLGEFNKIEAELSRIGLQREWSKIQGHNMPLGGESENDSS